MHIKHCINSIISFEYMMISHTLKIFLLFFICTTFSCRISSSFNIPTNNIYSSILAHNLDKLPSQDEAIHLFQQWTKEHGRVYQDLGEMAKKFENFLSNLKLITASNARRKSTYDFVLGLNIFADWSAEEFKEIYLHDIDMPKDNKIMKLDDLPCRAPSYLDWR